MAAKILSFPRSGTQGPAATSLDLAVIRSRTALEEMWARKLAEVVALDSAICRTSAAGDDPPADWPAPDRLYVRAARAYEELGAIADALSAIDRGPSRQ